MFMWIGQFHGLPTDEPEEKIETHRNKLLPLPNEKFRVITSLNKELEEGVSLQYGPRKCWYLTCSSKICYIEPRKKTHAYDKRSSFIPLIGLWYDGYITFESPIKTGHYMRFKRNYLMMDRYDGTESFKQDASFLLKEKTESDIVKNISHTTKGWVSDKIGLRLAFPFGRKRKQGVVSSPQHSCYCESLGSSTNFFIETPSQCSSDDEDIEENTSEQKIVEIT